jgi:hypothetical protein
MSHDSSNQKQQYGGGARDAHLSLSLLLMFLLLLLQGYWRHC